MDPTMPDVTPLLQTPLFRLAYLGLGIALLTWLVTEAGSVFIPIKWRPVVPLILGPFLGWGTQASALLDFGPGPGSWGRALIFGLAGGAFAVVAHPWIKTLPPFSWLTRLTPSSPSPPPPAGGSTP